MIDLCKAKYYEYGISKKEYKYSHIIQQKRMKVESGSKNLVVKWWLSYETTRRIYGDSFCTIFLMIY